MHTHHSTFHVIGDFDHIFLHLVAVLTFLRQNALQTEGRRTLWQAGRRRFPFPPSFREIPFQAQLHSTPDHIVIRIPIQSHILLLLPPNPPPTTNLVSVPIPTTRILPLSQLRSTGGLRRITLNMDRSSPLPTVPMMGGCTGKMRSISS